MYTWNLFVLYFEAHTLQKNALSNQNNGRPASRYIYIYVIYVYPIEYTVRPMDPTWMSQEVRVKC